MRILLDSTVLIDVLRGRTAIQEAMADAARMGHEICTSAINIAEVYSGVRKHEESATEEFLGTLRCFPVTCTLAEHGGRLRNEWARQGVTFGVG